MIGMIFKAIDRAIPTVEEVKLRLPEIIARNQAEMAKDVFTDEQVADIPNIKNSRLRERVKKFASLKSYLETGLPSFDDAKIARYLQAKRRASYMEHDPIDAFPVEKMGSTVEHEKMYGILFSGIDLEAARQYCKPSEYQDGTDDDGMPVMRLRSVRAHAFNFSALPRDIKIQITAKLVPLMAWDASLMRLKHG